LAGLNSFYRRVTGNATEVYSLMWTRHQNSFKEPSFRRNRQSTGRIKEPYKFHPE